MIGENIDRDDGLSGRVASGMGVLALTCEGGAIVVLLTDSFELAKASAEAGIGFGLVAGVATVGRLAVQRWTNRHPETP